MGWPLRITFAVLVAIVAVVVFQPEDEALKRMHIVVITESPDVEEYLVPFKSVIGNDYDGYRNHIYRVLSFAVHFLHNNQSSLDVLGPALVFHDIALWTDNKLAYLEPSVQQARKALPNLSAERFKLVEDIIVNHHKVTDFSGPGADLVNAVRKADWVDASLGLVRFGMPAEQIGIVTGRLPNAGFHNALLSLFPRIRGWNFPLGLSEFLTIFRW